MSCLESHLFSMSIKKKKSNESCLKLLQVVKFFIALLAFHPPGKSVGLHDASSAASYNA